MFAVSPSLDWRSQAPLFSLLFSHLNPSFGNGSDWCCSYLTQGSTSASSEGVKTSLLKTPHVTQPWITLVSFTAASIISSSSQLTGEILDIGTYVHTTVWFSCVKVVPSPVPHCLSSSVLPVPHNLLFWYHRPTFNFKVNNENTHQGWFQNWSKRSS